MTTAVILQPGYLPWLGFFEQMWQADCFVFYDDVQYDKNGWRNRNRIKTPQGPHWLTVPVRAHLGDAVKGVKIDNKQKWTEKQIKTIEQFYAQAPFFQEYFPAIRNILSAEYESLIDLDVALIEKINSMLGLNRKILFSSKLKSQDGGKIGRLINICKEIGADAFYEGAAGANYIDDEEFAKNGIKIIYQDYKHPEYRQLYGKFEPYLSILDLLFNEGPDSLKILTHDYQKI
jgi:hypothetical protein